MPAAFLHGVETIDVNSGPVQVQVVKSAVIGLIGIAPSGPINTPIMVTGPNSAAQFGAQLPGFNIPQALDQIFKQGAAVVVVINVFDPASDTTQVTGESHTPTNGKLKLSFAPIGTISIFAADGTTPSTLVLGTDYTFDPYGNFQALTTSVINGTALKFNYKKLNTAAITAALLIGTTDGSGNKTGMQAWALARNLFGFNPKILIAPGHSDDTDVSAELISQATSLRAIALLDAPHGTSVTDAIAGRGIAGEINFNTSSKRAYLLYPYLKAYDIASDSDIDVPYSPFMAGLIAASDLNNGFWFSPSNQEILGIVGAERNISASLNDASADANILNEVGITTIFNTFGTGIRTWGNRNASFPTNTDMDNFLSVLRTKDVVDESLENAVLQFIDKPINQALIDTIRESANSFIRTLIGRGALIVGSAVTFSKDDNPDTEIAAGHLTFETTLCPPPPLERITFNSFIDISLLKSLQ